MLVLSQLSIILIKSNIELEVANNVTSLISSNLLYFFNLIIAIVIYTDMKKFKITSWVTLILTIFLNWAGIIFFLIGYSHEINNKNT